MASMQIENWPIDRLREYERNPRKNNHAVASMADAIKAFGFRVPIVARSNGEICDGHLRLKAARKLKMKEVPVILADDMTDEQIKAFRISVNKAATWAEWDVDLLKLELGELKALNFDLAPIGFSVEELGGIFAEKAEGLTDPDEVPDEPAEPVTVLGDVWLLGSHRLVCGDSTTVESVDKALNGVKPHLMVTDPPYGVEYDADWRNKRLRSDGSPIGGRAIGKVSNDDRADWSAAWELFSGDVAYVWCASLHNPEAAQSLLASGFALRSLIIWAKHTFAIGRSDYHWQHEPCWYVVRDKATGHWNGGRKQSTLWQIDKPQKSETGHSTQKPVECMKRPIENNSSPGQAVYEPFSGVGTTIIAGEMTGRSVHAIELSPTYVDVSVARWEAFTGRKAVLESTGKTFAETAEERNRATAA